MLELSGICKNFGNQITLRDIELTVHPGEFFSLLGPSGCGKTTLLRIIAGLEAADQGDLRLDGKSLTDLTAQKRPFNLVFQKYALFPHMTVSQNLEFGLQVKNVPSPERRTRVEEMLKLVNLAEFAGRYPETLSGGQAQRVALARALINKPRVLLLDEPLSALDLKMRERMQVELRSLQKKLGLTFIFVTHDQEEAFALSDRIAVMNKGRIEQVGRPQDLYENPQSPFVAEFIGDMNRVSADPKEVKGGLQVFDLKGQDFFAKLKSESVTGRMFLYIRPEHLSFDGGHKDLRSLTGRILNKVFRGDHFEIQFQISDEMTLRVYHPAKEASLQEDKIFYNPKDVLAFPEEAGS